MGELCCLYPKSLKHVLDVKVDACNKKNFIVVNHGVPIDPDYNIITEPKNVIDHHKAGQRPGDNSSRLLKTILHEPLSFIGHFFVLSPSTLTPSKLERQVFKAIFFGSILFFYQQSDAGIEPGTAG